MYSMGHMGIGFVWKWICWVVKSEHGINGCGDRVGAKLVC